MIFDIRKAYSYFKQRWALKKSTNGFYDMKCPFDCHDCGTKRKFHVNFQWDRVGCWKCPYTARIVDFVMDVEGVPYGEAKLVLHNQEIIGNVEAEVLESVKVLKQSSVDMPHGFNALLDGEGVLGVRARNYMAGRGFDLEALDKKGFGYCNSHTEEKEDDYFGYIIIPFKYRGSLQYYIGRDYLETQFLRYKNPPTTAFGIGKADLVYNMDALDLCDEVFISEGAMDAETMGDAGIATLGWSISPGQHQMIMRSKVKRLVFCPDKRNATEDFYKMAVKAALKFIDQKECYIINTDGILPDQPQKKDINALGRDLFLDARERTKKLTPSAAMDIIM
jgi:DNA primase